MKKILIISSFLMIIMSFTMLGYKFVSATEQIDEIEEKIDNQKNQEKYLTPYGYTLENPNIINNPYGDSPLSAMILFETPDKTKVTIKLYDSNNQLFIENTYQEDTKHIIPIYGLLPNQTNKIEIKTNKESKIYEIKTTNIEMPNLPENIISNQDKLTLIMFKNHIYGIDQNKNIHWYYKNKVVIEPYLLKNGNFLLEINNNQRYSLIEIDLLGKIYKQINLENKINSILETNDSLLLLSNNLTELDWQSGQIKRSYDLKNKYDQLKELKEESLVLTNDHQQSILNLKTGKEQISEQNNNLSTTTNISLNPYQNNTNYKFINGMIFRNDIKTPTSKTNIFLINYKKIDDNYQKYQINIKKTKETIILTGNFSQSDEVHIILDKFLDKRVYDINENTTIINQYGLSGKYSIYIKINQTIYKTNTYIKI